MDDLLCRIEEQAKSLTIGICIPKVGQLRADVQSKIRKWADQLAKSDIDEAEFRSQVKSQQRHLAQEANTAKIGSLATLDKILDAILRILDEFFPLPPLGR